MKVVGLMDVRSALHDDRFQALFPELKHEIDKFLSEPKCGACAVPVIREILNKFPERVEKYFPGRKVVKPDDEAKKLAENNFTVINCHIDELEDKLRRLAPGRKQLGITRYADQVTCVVNELTVIF